MAQLILAPDGGDVRQKAAENGIDLAEQLPVVGAAGGDEAFALGPQLFPEARLLHIGVDRPGLLLPGGAPATSLPEAFEGRVQGGADPLRGLRHLPEGEGLA